MVLPLAAGMAMQAGAAVFSGYSARRGASKQNKRSRQMAIYQNNWTKEMSNTAHQRERADLLAAGLNPILGISQGGSSTPQAASMQPPENTAKAGLEARNQAMQAAASVQNLQADTDLKKDQSEVQSKTLDQIGATIQNIESQTMVNGQTAKKIQNENVTGDIRANLLKGLDLSTSATNLGTTSRSLYESMKDSFKNAPSRATKSQAKRRKNRRNK